MEQDPLGQFMAAHPKGGKVTGTVKEVDAKGATVDLGDGVEGYVSARDISHDRVDDASLVLKVGQQVEAKLVGTDRKGRSLQLSIKDKDAADTAEALADYNNKAHSDAASGTTKLGALLREQLNSKAD
jgi:small subunit ribosomal protein S1